MYRYDITDVIVTRAVSAIAELLVTVVLTVDEL